MLLWFMYCQDLSSWLMVASFCKNISTNVPSVAIALNRSASSNSTIFGTYSKVAKNLNWLTKENHWFSNIYGCKKNFLPCCEKAQFLQPNFDLLVIGFTTEISNSCAIYFLPSIPPRCYLCNKHSNFCIELHEFRHF